MIVAPNIRRKGVIGGFSMAIKGTLAPSVSKGVLFAQGAMWRPSAAPTAPAAPTSALSHLAYNSTTGLYWSTTEEGATAGDAVLGWALAGATELIAVSQQVFRVAAPGAGSGGSGSGGSFPAPVPGDDTGSGAVGTLDGFYLVPIVLGIATPDLALGLKRNQEILLAAPAQTTIAANVATGAAVVTPASMARIAVGGLLTVANADDSNSETVAVTAVTGSTFTATFTSTKTGPDITAMSPPLSINLPASAPSTVSWRCVIVQDADGGASVAFDAGYVGVGPDSIDVKPDVMTWLHFFQHPDGRVLLFSVPLSY